MIIKSHKGRNELILGLIVVVIVLISFVKLTDVKILVENYREKILTYDLGFSRWHNISDSGISKSDQIISAFKKMPSIIYANIIGFDRNHIEKLEIDIKFLDYQKILFDRDKAIKDQILRNPQTVKAVIKYKNKIYKAKIRLKGDLPDHWTSVHRMSMRINLKGKNTIHGLNEFNIQKPRTRVYPYDAVFQDTIKSTGNLATEHNYVKVTVNGSDWGVMDLESHIGKEFLERNTRKESLIVRFSNEDGWFYQKTNNNYVNKHYRLSDPILFSKVYGASKNFDMTSRERYTYIVEQRIKKNAELYDVNPYTRLMLLAKLWGEIHVLYENNTKHYFNPYTLKLEPISSDQFQPKKLSEDGDVFNLVGGCQDNYAFVANEPYQSIKNTKEYSSKLMGNYRLVLNKINLVKDFLKEHHSYFPLDNEPSAEILYSNLITASNLGKKLFAINDQCKETINSEILAKWREGEFYLPQHTQAHHYDDGKVKIYNLLPDNIKLLGIRVDNDRLIPINGEIPGHDNNAYNPYIIDTNLTSFLDDKLELVTQYQGKIKYQKLYKTLISGVKNPLLEENVLNFDFVNKKDDDTWVIPKGEWIVKSPIIVNGNLIIEPDVKLLFDDHAYLVVHGRIVANGKKHQKIILTSKNKSWMGLYVYESKLDSSLNNVVISNTSSINDKLLKLSGGVTFYKSNVNITNSKFTSSTAEDMLNFVKSKYVISDSVMLSARSDAIDSDFSDGYIRNLIIDNVGGDAIDTSGTNLKILNLKVSQVIDKAISAGESSSVSISKCSLENVGVGIASKDGSNVSVSGCTIKNAKLSALMSYTKKDFYGKPGLDVRLSNLDVKTKFIRQREAKLVINGELVPYSNLNVGKLYKSTFMKK
jgi:hypothetical protein